MMRKMVSTVNINQGNPIRRQISLETDLLSL